MYLIIKIVFATIFLFFFLKSLKDSLVYPDPEGYISVIEKSQKLLKKLICDATFQDLNFIGKLTFSGLSVIHFNKLQNKSSFFSCQNHSISCVFYELVFTVTTNSKE